MSRIAVFFSAGFEEIEALTVVDLCRRAGIETAMVSIDGEKTVTGSHGIAVQMDQVLGEVDFERVDMIVLPGGLPGTNGLEACAPLMEQVDRFYREGKYVAAICAAPSIFGHRGILRGRKACSYPSFESHLEGASVSNSPVEVDGNVITSRGMGTAFAFGLAIVALLAGQIAADELAVKTVYR